MLARGYHETKDTVEHGTQERLWAVVDGELWFTGWADYRLAFGNPADTWTRQEDGSDLPKGAEFIGKYHWLKS